MDKQEELQKLNLRFSKENLCELKNTAKQAVFGYGSAKASIVFIGEAPGKKEDETGRPFVGASGKFLDEMLLSIGIKREEVYITNIVKYRPPNNRDPKPIEKDQCKDWLYAELNLISPKIVVFLGRHSLNHFFPDLKISAAHGKLVTRKIKDINTEIFLPLYHPAAALYNGSMKETLKKDFKVIKKIFK